MKVVKIRLRYTCSPTKFLSILQNSFFYKDLFQDKFWMELTPLKNHTSKIRQRVAENIDHIALILQVNPSTRTPHNQIFLRQF